jgi:hypothetical protein
MGRLPAGRHDVEVLSITQERRPTLILQATNGHCHAETLEWQACLAGVKPGDRMKITVAARSGYVVERDGGAYRPKDADTGAVLGEFRPDLSSVATDMQVRSIPPANTFLATIHREGEDGVHTLAAPSTGIGPTTGSDLPADPQPK